MGKKAADVAKCRCMLLQEAKGGRNRTSCLLQEWEKKQQMLLNAAACCCRKQEWVVTGRCACKNGMLNAECMQYA
jgi:hypothetical protein